MRPVSDRFLAALRGSHSAPVQALVVAPGQTGTDPDGTEILVLGGDVELDAKADVRSTLELFTDGTGAFPDAADDLFAPFGNEIFVRRGVGFGGGSVEWVSLGYFRIQSSEQDDAPDGPIRIGGQDRMSGIIEARLLEPRQFPAVDTYGDVLADLVEEVFPAATIVWDDTTDADPLGRAVIAEEDRFEFLNDLITSLGKIWYWDHRGILVVKDAPDPEDVVWEVNAGADGVLVDLSRDLSREGVYNAVVASGEALDTTAPPRGVAVDDNPDSPTYWDGAFGKVPRFYSSPFITSEAQALTSAAAILRRNLGLPYNVRFGQVPNPALEPHDPVAVNSRGALRLERPRTFLTDAFGRTVADTWGTADSGAVWTNSAPGSAFDVAGGEGTWAAASAGDVGRVVALGVSETDVDGYYVVSTPVAVAGAALVMRANVRYVDLNNNYMVGIELSPGGAVAVKAAKYTAGVYTELGSLNPVPGAAYVAGARWAVRVRAVGTALKVRVWPDGEVEPTNWHLQVTDSDHAAGSVGMWFWRVSPNSNTGAQFHVDDIVWRTWPGVAEGAELHVLETVKIPLDVDTVQRATTRQQTLVVIGEDDA